MYIWPQDVIADQAGRTTADLQVPFYVVPQALISKWLWKSSLNVESLRHYIIMALKIIDLELCSTPCANLS